jgi:endoglucanase
MVMIDGDVPQAGVNLGGWLSQYREYDSHHFETFISADDIRRIAAWGMDHVRLPIDYLILEDDERPGGYKDNGFAYLDQCLAWCQANGLRLILDLQKAPGFSFDTLAANTLFNQPALQDRFINLWRALARHYQAEGDGLIFELLNEIVLPGSKPWNALAKRTIAAIRRIDPNRQIIIGGNRYNAASELAALDVYDDPNVIYTFHFYEPFIFTHQRAYWMPFTDTYPSVVEYPGECGDLAAFLDQHPDYRSELGRFVGLRLDRDLIRRELQPAIEFRQRTGRSIYCGEFGVIDRAPLPDRIRWHRDFVDLLNENRIGHAVWSYKVMDFGLIDSTGQVVDELVKVVSERN